MPRLRLPLPSILVCGIACLPSCTAPEAAGPTDAASVEVEAPSEVQAAPRAARVWSADEGDRLWFAPESADELGSGGEFHIYLDHETDPEAGASFAKFALGVGGALPEHRHALTEEIAYFVSGSGVARFYEDGELQEATVAPGSVWYNPPGVWHSVANTGGEPLVLVFATIPNEEKGLLSFFRQMSVRPGQEPVTIPPEEFGRLAVEHDMILRGPAEEE